MDELRAIFPGHPDHLLERAFGDADEDLIEAIDSVLGQQGQEPEDHEQKVRLQRQQQQQEEEQQQQQQQNQRQRQPDQRPPAPIRAQRIREELERPLLSPSTASANSFGFLSISDADDGDDDGGFGGDSDGMEMYEDEPPIVKRDGTGSGKQVEGRGTVASQEDVLQNVLSIFPDACLKHLTKLYREYHLLQGSDITEFIANKLAETDYPKAESVLKAGTKRKRVEDDEKEEKGPDYEAIDRPPVVGERYDLVNTLLRQEFPLTPVRFIEKVMTQNRNYLAKSYSALVKADKSHNSQVNLPYKKLIHPRKLEVESDRLKMGKDWTEIIAELEYARGEARREELKAQMEADARLAAQINEKEHEESNMLIECMCCFGEYPFDSMTHCNELHFFCLDCARRNAETEVGNGRHKLSCMDGSGCKAEFSRREILRFLDEKTLSALAKIEQEDALRIAEIDGLVKCPFCDYGAICAPAEVDKEFKCQNPECMEVSCRLCDQKSHIPLTCKEYAKENKLNVRHTVEEAMTEALVRKCNKCSYPYIKEYGCNKIHCNRCNTLQCYICSQTIKNYDHFNDPARGGKVGNCPLFDNTEERHHGEVEAAARKAMDKLREEHPELAEEDLKIELSEKVKKEEEAKRSRGAPNGGIPAYQPQAAPYPPPPAPRRRMGQPPAPPPQMGVGIGQVARGGRMQRMRDLLHQAVQVPPAQPAPVIPHIPPAVLYNAPQNAIQLHGGGVPMYPAPYYMPEHMLGAKPEQQDQRQPPQAPYRGRPVIPVRGPAFHAAPVVDEHIPPPPPQPPPPQCRRVLSRRNTVAARPVSADVQRQLEQPRMSQGPGQNLRFMTRQAQAQTQSPASAAGSAPGVSAPRRRR